MSLEDIFRALDADVHCLHAMHLIDQIWYTSVENETLFSQLQLCKMDRRSRLFQDRLQNLFIVRIDKTFAIKKVPILPISIFSPSLVILLGYDCIVFILRLDFRLVFPIRWLFVEFNWVGSHDALCFVCKVSIVLFCK